MLKILMLCAAISLIVDMIFEKDKSTAWIEGAAIFLAVFVCSFVASYNDYQKEKQFAELKKISQNSEKVTVIRRGRIEEIKWTDIMVGDLIKLKVGMKIDCDGLLVEGSHVTMDESSLTGESKPVLKRSFENCLSQKVFGKVKRSSPILVSHSTVQTGEGRFICIAVGRNSQKGKIESQL